MALLEKYEVFECEGNHYGKKENGEYKRFTKGSSFILIDDPEELAKISAVYRDLAYAEAQDSKHRNAAGKWPDFDEPTLSEFDGGPY